jgi:holliday junction DNA helicase RuvB
MEERNFRSSTLNDFIGQARIKQRVGLMLNSARLQDVDLELVCFYGGAGLGKTSLVGIIAVVKTSVLREVPDPSIERLGDLVAIQVGLRERDVLFVD